MSLVLVAIIVFILAYNKKNQPVDLPVQEETEDDQKKAEEKLQKITDEYVKKIDDICAAKTAEILEI